MMGVIAESMAAYAQPLIDGTDGSHEEISKALSIAQICWNLALLPDSDQAEMLAEMRPVLKMDAAEFAEFRQSVIEPMIRRHHEMFPSVARLDSQETGPLPRQEKYPGTRRNAPCPCNSGKKYKHCCGK
jgi:uncharacterized protein YecA (UPF0149 family)